MKKRTSTALLLFGVFTHACAMPVDDAPIPGDIEHAIRHPDNIEVDGAPGLVRIGTGCTATMIGPRLILTAAHCVDALPGALTMVIRYFEPGLDASSPRSLGALGVRIHLNPLHTPWDGQGGVTRSFADHDSALIELTSASRWPGTDYRDYRRVYQDFGRRLPDHLDAYGQGFATISGNGFGTLRRGRFEVAAVGDYRIALHQTRDKGMCLGDSGGPWVVPGHDLVACITSSTPLDSGTCGQDHGVFDISRARCTRAVWSNVGDLVTTHTDAPVYSFNDGTYDYTRFFDIPFVNEVDGEGLDRGLAAALVITII